MTNIEKALRWCCIIGVFAISFIPLIVSTSMFFPYITGKNFAFRIIVELITASWLALALVNPAYRPRRSWLLVAFASFVTIVALADAQGAYPFKSFWSNYERMDGWVTLVHLFAYFVVAISILNTEKLWHRLWQTTLGVSVYLAIYGVLQVSGLADIGQGGSAGLNSRVDASLGNPIYLAAFMLFSIFVAAFMWVRTHREHGDTKKVWHHTIYGGIIVLDTIAMLLTATRGTILGLIGGTIVALLLIAFFKRDARRIRMAAVGLIAAVIVGGIGLFAARDTAFVQSVGFLNRLSTISTQDNTTKSRFFNWQMAWQGVKERPILGWGQENYAVVFDKYYDPRMYAQEPWFDRVHNIIFDWLVAAGFVGLISYLSLFAATLWALWWRSNFTIVERSIFTGLLAGYFFHNLFVFDNITSYILFTMVIAYIQWHSDNSQDSEMLFKGMAFKRNLVMPLTVGSFAMGAVIVWFVNIPAIQTNHALISALQQRDNVTQSLEEFQRAIGYGSFGTQEVREQMIQMAAQMAGIPSIPLAVKQRFAITASDQMILQSKESPLDARFPLFLGVLLGSYGDFINAEKELTKALSLSPTKQTILYQLASNAKAKGDTAGGIAYLEKAYDLAPDNSQARDYLVAAYVSQNDYNKIVTLMNRYLQHKPQDPQAYFTLSGAYYALGDKQKSIDTLQLAAEKIPAVNAQTQEFIQQIKNGTVKVK